MSSITVAQLAEKLNGDIAGNPEALLTGVAGLRDAGEGDLSFLANPKYSADLLSTNATCVIVSRTWKQECTATVIKVDNPDDAFTSAAALFAPEPVDVAEGIHETAVIADDAELGAGVRIGPHAVVEPGAKIGANTRIGAGVYVGHRAEIGTDCFLYPNVTVRERCRLGNRVILHSSTVVGSDGFGYVADEKGVRTKIPQTGIVILEDDVELGACVTVDRARFGKTVIGKGTKVDNLVQIAHNVVIGEHAVLVSQVGIAGSTSIGKHAILAGQAGVAGHLDIGDGAIIGSKSAVLRDVPAKSYVIGYPAIPQKDFMRIQRPYLKLPELKTRVSALEKELETLKKQLSK